VECAVKQRRMDRECTELRVPALRQRHLGKQLLASAPNRRQSLEGGAVFETSLGKDTPSGHWEIAGTPVRFKWGYFPRTIPALPRELTQALIAEGRLPGILGDKHASGTDVIEDLGEEHLRSLKPIDTDTLVKSVQKTKRLLTFDQSYYTLCPGAEVIARVAENVDGAKFKRIAFPDAPPPAAPEMFNWMRPNADHIIAAAKKFVA